MRTPGYAMASSILAGSYILSSSKLALAEYSSNTCASDNCVVHCLNFVVGGCTICPIFCITEDCMGGINCAYALTPSTMDHLYWLF